MTTRIISADNESAGTIRCAHVWDHHATHIELSNTHDHDPSNHIVVCAECAFLAGLLPCKACTVDKILVRSGAATTKMTPVYAPSELMEGFCAKHARHRLQPAMIRGVSPRQADAS